MIRVSKKVIINTDALVLRQQNLGESDRIITILTRDYGVLRAFANRGRNLKGSLQSATQQLCYGRFAIYKGRDKYIINEASSLEMFFSLRQNMDKLALAQYFSELVYELAADEEGTEPFLRLVLNSFHMLAKDKLPIPQIKAIFELRILALSGYMPNLTACVVCGEFESDVMYFDFTNGALYCENCQRPAGAVQTGISVITAMRHIIFSKLEKLFSFTLSSENIKALSDITERFLLTQTARKYKTLDFFKSIPN